MKSQFRCILFALIAVPAACGGDRSTSTASSGDTSRVVKPVVIPPETVATPEPPKVEAKVEPSAPAPAVPTTYSETLAQGKAAAASGDHARARELFEAAVKLDKKAVEPHIELSRLFIAMGERHLAITAANKAIKLGPASSQAYNTLGRAELARFSYDDAIAAFRKATELNADNVWAWNNLGFTHLQLKHYQDAVDALTEATSRKGAEGFMWNNLGTAHEQLGQLDDARTAFENGGKLGSREALASRKRLEGVKAIIVMKTEKPDGDQPDATRPGASTDHGYDLSEPMPASVEGIDSAKAIPESAEPAEPAEHDDGEPVDESSADDATDAVKPEVAPTAEKPSAPSPI